jgi:hypothetical protein
MTHSFLVVKMQEAMGLEALEVFTVSSVEVFMEEWAHYLGLDQQAQLETMIIV